MVIASEPGWLHAAGQAAGTILLVELGFVLLIMLAFTVGVLVVAWWLRSHIVPVLREVTPRAETAMTTARQGTDKVVRGVAEFYGRRQQVETGLRVLLFGKSAAERVEEEARIHAAADLALMSPEMTGPSPENGWTPRPPATLTEQPAPTATSIAPDVYAPRPDGATPRARQREERYPNAPMAGSAS